MAQHSGFFSAFRTGGVYDRTYRSEDYCDNLAVIISSGVLRDSNNGLKVTDSGLNLTVNKGRAWIEGHWYKLDANESLPAVVPPTSNSRIDRVVLRLDKSTLARSITLQVINGTPAADPEAPALTRSGNVYEICLAELTVASGGSTVTLVDTRGDSALCGWVYSVSGDGSFFTALDEEFDTWFQATKSTLASVTLFKQYRWHDVMIMPTSTISFTIPQYDSDTCFIDVFVDGLYYTDYTVSGHVITFGSTLPAATVIDVLAYKSIDGTGIMTVSDEITQLQNEVAAISGAGKYTYMCTGADDNISISQIVQAINSGSYVQADVTTAADDFLTGLGGNAYLSGLNNNSQLEIHIAGKLGIQTPYGGAGSLADPYVYFNLGTSTRKVVLDFANAEDVEITVDENTTNVIFYGRSAMVINGAFIIDYSGYDNSVKFYDNNGTIGKVEFQDCKIQIEAYLDAVISSTGRFINCYADLRSMNGNAFCFSVSNSLVRVIGGTYKAYNKTPHSSAIFHVTDGVIAATNVNCPQKMVGSFQQKYLAYREGYGTISIVQAISTLTNSGTVDETGRISVNKDVL